MFANVLIGIDGRQGGRDAIALARRIAGPEATFMFAHVWKPLPSLGAAEAMSLERAESQRMLERERELAALDARLLLAGPTPVGRGLHELAEEQGPTCSSSDRRGMR